MKSISQINSNFTTFFLKTRITAAQSFSSTIDYQCVVHVILNKIDRLLTFQCENKQNLLLFRINKAKDIGLCPASPKESKIPMSCRHICFDLNYCSATCAKVNQSSQQPAVHHGKDSRFCRSYLFCGSCWGGLLKAGLEKTTWNNRSILIFSTARHLLDKLTFCQIFKLQAIFTHSTSYQGSRKLKISSHRSIPQLSNCISPKFHPDWLRKYLPNEVFPSVLYQMSGPRKV